MHIDRFTASCLGNFPERIINAMPANAASSAFGENARQNQESPITEKPRFIAFRTINHSQRVLRTLHNRQLSANQLFEEHPLTWRNPSASENIALLGRPDQPIANHLDLGMRNRPRKTNGGELHRRIAQPIDSADATPPFSRRNRRGANRLDDFQRRRVAMHKRPLQGIILDILIRERDDFPRRQNPIMVVLLPESTELSSVLWTITPKPRFSVPSGKLCLLLPTSSRPSLKPPDKTTENHERLWKPRFNINSEMNMIGHYDILIEPKPVYARAQIDKGFLNFLAKRSFHKFRRANRTQKRSPRLRDNSNHHRRPAAIVVAVKPMEMLDLFVVIHLLARSIPHPLVVPPSLRPHPDHDNVSPSRPTMLSPNQTYRRTTSQQN